MADFELESPALADRLSAHLAAKTRVWLGLTVGICLPYFALQSVTLAPLRSVPEIWVDEWIPLAPAFIWAYLSLGALVPLAPLLADTRDALARYARGLAWLCVPCFVAFALFPVEGPRPEIAPDHPLYRWIVSVDRPSNSMPSLHAGLTVYSLLFAARVLQGHLTGGRRTATWSIGCAWGVLILYSTIATKQHWFLDLPAGALIAVAAHAWAWRGAPAATPR